MIVSNVFIDAAVASGVLSYPEKLFIIGYDADNSSAEEKEVMEHLSSRLVLWATPTYNMEAV